jgi:hypothetical protein
MDDHQRIFILFTLLIFLVAACGNNGSGSFDTFPDVGIPANEMNKRFIIVAPEAINNFTTNDTVDLVVEVISDDQILFGYDYGARMFIFENGDWVEVPSFVNYPDGKVLLTNSQNDPFKRGYTFVSPTLSDPSKPVTLRIIVIGNIYRDEQITDEVAAAYLDVNLTP